MELEKLRSHSSYINSLNLIQGDSPSQQWRGLLLSLNLWLWDFKISWLRVVLSKLWVQFRMISEGRRHDELSVRDFLWNYVNVLLLSPGIWVLTPSYDTLSGCMQSVILARMNVVTWSPLETSLPSHDIIIQDLSCSELLDTKSTTRTVLLVVCGTCHHLRGKTSLLNRFPSNHFIGNLIIISILICYSI